MRDEWVNELNTADAEMDQRLTRALEARPVVDIPADFAARVARQLPDRRAIAVTPTHYGRKAMAICMVVLGVALLVGFVMRGAAMPPMVQVVGWILYAQFLGLVVWFGQGALRKLS
jgi:predicted phage tail protein